MRFLLLFINTCGAMQLNFHPQPDTQAMNLMWTFSMCEYIIAHLVVRWRSLHFVHFVHSFFFTSHLIGLVLLPMLLRHIDSGRWRLNIGIVRRRAEFIYLWWLKSIQSNVCCVCCQHHKHWKSRTIDFFLLSLAIYSGYERCVSGILISFLFYVFFFILSLVFFLSIISLRNNRYSVGKEEG